MTDNQNSEKKADLDKREYEASGEYSDIPLLTKVPKKISRNILRVISEDVAKKYQMAVIEKKGNLLKVAMVNPQDIGALNALRFIIEKEKLEVEIYVVKPNIFEDIIEKYSTAEKAVEEVVESFKGDDLKDLEFVRKTGKDLIKKSIQDAPVAKLVQVIIRHAIDGRASDVHIEPIENNYRVRFRVDGILHSSLVLPLDVGRAVVSRIKILSNLKIDEKRKPQDGRFKIDDGGESVDFRISTLPVVDGEKVAMRVLVKDEGMSNLDNLGLIGKNLDILNKRIKDPYGIILITGPTGSGKSTTLYAFLNILNNEDSNIITLEDPVEYFIEGANQSQIRPEIGYTFANGLRSILRQDPNIIMVGEIRDNETAELTIHAALTGHLVFSTLHTNDAVGSIPRMIDMDIEPFLLTSSLRVVVAQRLVRKICEKCKDKERVPQAIVEKTKKEIENIPKNELDKYGVNISNGLKFFKGKGCDSCGNSGFKGRLAVYEVLEVNEKIQDIISEGKGIEMKVREESKNQGMIKLRQDGILKALKGLTTLSEIGRVTDDNTNVVKEYEDI